MSLSTNWGWRMSARPTWSTWEMTWLRLGMSLVLTLLMGQHSSGWAPLSKGGENNPTKSHISCSDLVVWRRSIFCPLIRGWFCLWRGNYQLYPKASFLIILIFQFPGWGNEEHNEGEKGQMMIIEVKCISNSAGLGEQEAGPGRCQEQGQEGEEGVDAAKAGRVRKNICTVKNLNECTGWTISNPSFWSSLRWCLKLHY